jgi:G:T-mismatch repair DNA endonuclease (very short patch repair protein)
LDVKEEWKPCPRRRILVLVHGELWHQKPRKVSPKVPRSSTSRL